MSRTYDVVVIGAGSAGFAAARSARETDVASSILLINGEERPPYDRTTLSKTIKDSNAERGPELQPKEWYDEQRIERVDGAVVRSIDTAASTITIDGNGTEEGTVNYKSLVLATGARPLFPKLVRPHERGSFFVVRTSRDVDDLLEHVGSAKTVLIAGMGVLAVELSEQLNAIGKTVTLAGATPQLIPRQLSARASELLEEAMSRRNINLLFQEEIISFEENKKHSWSVEMLKHSSRYDMVVFCIGVEPETAPAAAAGIEINNGIRVDHRLQTSIPGVYAAGDCAELPDGRISFLWKEAAAQGAVAGINAAGGDATYNGVPYPLHSTIFGIDIYSIGKPRRPWNFRIDEFEFGNRYYAFYWSEGDRLSGAIVFNDSETALRAEQAVAEAWDRKTFEDGLVLN